MATNTPLELFSGMASTTSDMLSSSSELIIMVIGVTVGFIAVFMLIRAVKTGFGKVH